MNRYKTKVPLDEVRFRYFPQIRPNDAYLIFEFFMVYSRFEFALKHAGFRNNDRGYLMPDWESFSCSIQEKFYADKSSDLLAAYQYYRDHPPKIQTLVNEQLTWKPNRNKVNETEFTWVIRSIGIVRSNNLFHRGKFPWDQVRDETLLSNGLIILYECLDLEDSVSRAFTYLL